MHTLLVLVVLRQVCAAQCLWASIGCTCKDASVCLQVADANKENERDVKKKWRWLDMKSPERTREANLCASLHERVIAAGRQLGNMSPGDQVRHWRSYSSILDQVPEGLKARLRKAGADLAARCVVRWPPLLAHAPRCSLACSGQRANGTIASGLSRPAQHHQAASDPMPLSPPSTPVFGGGALQVLSSTIRMQAAGASC